MAPAIGAACRELPASPAAASAIASLGLHHHRIDIDLETQPDEVEWLERASLAAAAGAELELALTVAEATAGRVAGVLDAVRKVAPIARVLVLDAAGEVSAPALVAAVRAAAASAGVVAPIAGGTDLWFAELNRNAPVGDDRPWCRSPSPRNATSATTSRCSRRCPCRPPRSRPRRSCTRDSRSPSRR